MSKPVLECLSCHENVFKNDAEFVDEETFSFLSALPEGVEIGVYCYSCHESKVRPALNLYDESMEKARNVNVFFRTQGKESRFVRRIEKPLQVKDCTDRDEALLRLAFLAVQANKNALVDVDLEADKIRNGSRQTSIWKGRGIPADISEEQLARRFATAPN